MFISTAVRTSPAGGENSYMFATMFAILFLNYRIAFFLLAALIVGAAIPLAWAWARVLPEEAPPFRIEPGSFPSVDLEPPHEPSPKAKRDILAIALLVGVTLGYAVQFPGFPPDAALRWLSSIFPASAIIWIWITFTAETILLAVIGCAAYYAILRPGPLRTLLSAAAVLILILWLFVPLLQLALAAA
jgi:hypothetical protein